jgi:hypothetical protein
MWISIFIVAFKSNSRLGSDDVCLVVSWVVNWYVSVLGHDDGVILVDVGTDLFKKIK